MKSVGRVCARLDITLAIAALTASLVPTFVDRRGYIDAVGAYEKNPTPENGIALAQEYAENRQIILLTRLGVASVVFVIANVGWVLASRHKRQS
jgi:hypothetical protein